MKISELIYKNMDWRLLFILSSVIIGYLFYYMVDQLDLSKPLILHNHSRCERIEIGEATEDLASYGDYLIGATSDSINLYYKHLSASKALPGHLISIHIGTRTVSELPIFGFPSHIQINSHGLTIYNNKTLYLISHSYSKGGELVLVFDIQYTDRIEVKYLRTINLGDNYGAYNGIAVVNSEYFYITQWIGIPDTLEGRDNSLLTSLYRVFLFFFTKTNGVKLCRVAGDDAICEFKARGYMHNGIAKVDDTLYIADSMTKTVEVYNITKSLGLDHVASVKISHTVDNLHYSDGIIYAAGFTHLIDYAKFSDAVKKDRIWPFVTGGFSKIKHDSSNWVAEEVIIQDKISFTSTGTIVDNQAIISSVIDPALLFCELDNK